MKRHSLSTCLIFIGFILLVSCSQKQECNCEELYQDTDSLYYFPNYKNVPTNHEIAQYLGTDVRIASLQKKIDSLKSVVEKAKENLYKQLGRQYVDYSDSIRIYEKKLQEYKGAKSLDKIIRTLNNLGFIYFSQYDLAKSLSLFYESLKYAESMGNKEKMAVALTNISTIYSYKDEYRQAINYAQKAFELSNELGDKKSIVKSLLNLSSIYMYSEKSNEAYAYLKKAGNLMEELKNPGTNLVYSYSMMTASLLKTPEKALPVLESLYEKEYKNLNQDQQTNLLDYLSEVYRKNNNKLKETAVLEKLVALHPETYKYAIRLKAAKNEISQVEAGRMIMFKDSALAKEIQTKTVESELKNKDLKITILKTEIEIKKLTLTKEMNKRQLEFKNIHPDKKNSSVFNGSCESKLRKGDFENGKRIGKWKSK